MTSSGSLTREIFEEMEAGLEHLEGPEKYQRRRLLAIARTQSELEQIREDIRKQGVICDSSQDLEKLGEHQAAAIPVILNWLPKKTLAFRTIIQVFSQKWTREYARKELVDLYVNTDPAEIERRWYYGEYIRQLSDDRDFDELATLATDRSAGCSRMSIIEAISKTKKYKERAINILMDQIEDETVIIDVSKGLRRLKAVQARPLLEPYLKHKDSEIRSEVRRTIKKFDQLAPPAITSPST